MRIKMAAAVGIFWAGIQAALAGASVGLAPGAAAFVVSGQQPPGCREGYRRNGVLRDFALGTVWTVLSDCLHPERPAMAIAGSETGLAAGSLRAQPPVYGQGLVLRSGSPVRLWRQDGVVRVDLLGVALENGAPGSVIRVRIRPGGKVLQGTVRAAGSVELDAASDGFRQ